jgi:hypothetical protein
MSPAVFTACGPPHRGKNNNEKAFEVREECVAGDGGEIARSQRKLRGERLHN